MASVPGITFTHPAVVGGVVFAGSRDGGLYAFDTDCRTDGGPCRPAWTWGTGSSGPGIEAVAATDRRVYAITQTGRLLMFGLRPDGEVRRAGWGGVPLVPGVAALLALVAIVLIRRRAQAA
jgi:outer membrane protein assembly factor BamB